MKSMTGYGKGAATEGLNEVVIELRCVNNRYLEISSRLPKNFLACDEYLRGVIPKFVGRGSVDVFFNYVSAEREESVNADFALIKQYLFLAEKINKETGIPNDLSFTALMRGQGFINAGPKSDDTDTVLRLTAKAATEALTALEKMRVTEGESIALDLKKLIEEIKKHTVNAAQRAPLVVDEYRAKLSARMAEALATVAVDQVKLLNEVAFFADKADINEELQRLDSHISQFLDTIDASGTVGRKLDFICQEMGREINTMGSKSNDIVLTGYVVEMKNILEKIKEQIRNVE